MPSPFSDKNALYLLTILEALEKITIYANGYNTQRNCLTRKIKCPIMESVIFCWL
jgi:hypothetical protein